MREMALAVMVLAWITIGLGVTRAELRDMEVDNEVDTMKYGLIVLLWPSLIIERAYAEHVASQKTGRLH